MIDDYTMNGHKGERRRWAEGSDGKERERKAAISVTPPETATLNWVALGPGVGRIPRLCITTT